MFAYRPVRLFRALVAGATSTSLAVVALAAPATAEPGVDPEEARRQVAALYHQAEQATERYNDVRIALRAVEREFARAQRESARQQRVVDELRREVGAVAAETYRNGGVDPTLQLVFSEDPAAFLERAAALNFVAERQAATLRRVVAAQRTLRAHQKDAAERLTEVETQRRALGTEKAEVQRKLGAARAILNRLDAEDRRPRERSSRTTGRSSLKNLPAAGSARAAEAVRFALNQVGDRYVWAAAGPDAWDCSGLTMGAWGAAGVALPHSSAQQFATGRKIPRSELAPGDLVYFYSPISHVAIYIGNGLMVDAPNPSERVRVSPISIMPWAGATRP